MSTQVHEDFRSAYYERMHTPRNVQSERRIIVDHLERMHELVKPEKTVSMSNPDRLYSNADRQHLLGRFRDPDLDRKFITADMDIIDFYTNQLRVQPPSFVEAGPREFNHFNPTDARVGVLTSGGIAPGLNTVVESIVIKHIHVYRLETGGKLSQGRIFGFHDGLIGLGKDDFVPLNAETVENWCQLGGSQLGVGRTKADVPGWMSTIKKRGIQILYVIGGNGSMTAAHDIAQRALRDRIPLSVVAVPKTMDNDVLWVWQSFGFGTAVEKATEIVNVLHTEAESNRRVCVVQLFGADSGHVAANASLASGEVDAVLIPEEDFEPELVSEHVTRTVGLHGHAVVVMSEGARGMEKVKGQWRRWGASAREERNSNFERLQQVIRRGLRSHNLDRHEVFGNQPQHVIRAIPANSHDQIYCRRLGDMAVDTALAGYTDVMVSSWLTEYVVIPLYLTAKGGITGPGVKTFPTGGIFWRTVLRSTGQPSFLSQEAVTALEKEQVKDEE